MNDIYTLTLRCEQGNTTAVHNDRRFDYSDVIHIHNELVENNRYWDAINGDDSTDFDLAELEVYEHLFREYLDLKNEKAIKARHPERVMTMDQYRKAPRSRPQEVIFQVGDHLRHIAAELLWQIACAYRLLFEQIYGRICRILNMALHVDEATPHVHIRRVWIYRDSETGLHCVNRNQALTQNVWLNPYQTTNKFYNVTTEFSREDRLLAAQVCKAYGVEVDISHPIYREHLPTSQYKELMQYTDTESEIRDGVAGIGFIPNVQKIKSDLHRSINLNRDDPSNPIIQLLISYQLEMLNLFNYLSRKHLLDRYRAERSWQYIKMGYERSEITSIYKIEEIEMISEVPPTSSSNHSINHDDER